MRPSIFRCRCPFGDEECQNMLTISTSPYIPATDLDPAEGPDLTATGCPHVDHASDHQWRGPGGMEEILWALVEERAAQAQDAEWDRRIHAAREGA